MIIWKLPRSKPRGNVRASQRSSVSFRLLVSPRLFATHANGELARRLFKVFLHLSQMLCQAQSILLRHQLQTCQRLQFEKLLNLAQLIWPSDMLILHPQLPQEIKALLFLGTLLRVQSTVKSVYYMSTVSKPHARSEK